MICAKKPLKTYLSLSNEMIIHKFSQIDIKQTKENPAALKDKHQNSTLISSKFCIVQIDRNEIRRVQFAEKVGQNSYKKTF